MGQYIKRNILLSVLLLATAIFGLVALISHPLASADQASGYLETKCGNGIASYREIDLNDDEKLSFSPGARVFEALNSKNQKLKIISDLTYGSMSQAEADLKLVISSENNLKIENERVVLTDQSGDNTTISERSEGLYSPSPTVFSKSLSLDFPLKAQITIAAGSDCLFVLPDVLKFATKNEVPIYNSPKNGISLKSNQNYTILPGWNVIGFSKWTDLEPFFKKNISIFYFSGGSWRNASASRLASPDLGYFAFNPNSSSDTILANNPFRTPGDFLLPSLQAGWNFLVNPYDTDTKISDYLVSAGDSSSEVPASKSLYSLISDNSVSKSLYLVKKGQNNEFSSIENVGPDTLLPANSGCWIYLFSTQKTESIKSGLSAKLVGGGDSVQAGQKINLKLQILNQSGTTKLIDDLNQSDLCQIGFSVSDSSDKIIAENQAKNYVDCPFWPKFIKLEPNDKKEYNIAWTVPENISGKIKVKAYFNYSRLLSVEAETYETEMFVK